jgi:hypothetical protein
MAKLVCPAGYACLERLNPNGGLTNFDNLASASLTVFSLFTLDHWSDVMYLVNDATQNTNYDIFFILIVLMGSFFIVNMVTAVQFFYYS